MSNPIASGFASRLGGVRFFRSRVAHHRAGKTRFPPKVVQGKTLLRLQYEDWFGQRNIKGDAIGNKYFYPSKHHVANYIRPREDQGNPNRDDLTVAEPSREDPFVPFPDNPYTRTNTVIPESVRDHIIKDVTVNNMSLEDVSAKYGIQLVRVRALMKLNEVRENFKCDPAYKKDLTKFSSSIVEMLPRLRVNYTFKEGDQKREERVYFKKEQGEQNLSEIPVPSATRGSRFMTMAESEPFGPLESAKLLDLPPAADVVEKLQHVVADHAETAEIEFQKAKAKGDIFDVVNKSQTKPNGVIFRFKKAQVGKVGHRYGAYKDDRKKNRQVVYDRLGNRQWAY
ncbi:37S ribosomal protein S35 [Yarrowia sp. C11]|nr:37S ribosomal protein S35 [Yarrowia sp. E02]KAG5369667.1 37S ribosomal protein S35 [Yarrowia sp. C11]